MSNTTHHLPAGDRALRVKEVLEILGCSRTFLYGPRGRAIIGDGFTLGRSRRYLASKVAEVLASRGAN